MSRLCPITGKKGLSGNHVSHANNKSKRRYQPNLQQVSLMSEALGRSVHMRMTTRGLKTVEFHGGLDAFLLRSSTRILNSELRSLKKIITARQTVATA
ncbi:MAG: 50S ribosomal protein L28 [Candidatus Paracaedibacteraceae bacterium]|nr:50S ribosomal protein L28 [Candidatus Paracaedibacteraceae bacterium]